MSDILLIFSDSKLPDFEEEQETYDKNELFALFKEGEGVEYAEAVKKNVVRLLFKADDW